MITSPTALALVLPMPCRGETPCQGLREVEVALAAPESEKRGLHGAVTQTIGRRHWNRWCATKEGRVGIDEITVQQLPHVPKARGPEIVR